MTLNGVEFMKNKTQKVVFASLFAAIVFVATVIVKIPSPLKGYLNLGDCVVLLAGWALSPMYGFLAAGLGSAIADIQSGYMIYAPATFLIKGIMALVVSIAYVKYGKGLKTRIVSGLFAEIFMVFGYYIFEGFLYGFGPALLNVLPNAFQGIVGLIIFIIISQKKRILK